MKKAGCSAFAGSSGHARETRSHENQPGQSRQNDDDTHDVDHIHCLLLCSVMANAFNFGLAKFVPIISHSVFHLNSSSKRFQAEGFGGK
jgi:hypothetical protein